MLTQRTSGILMHISSLPGRYGIGDLGPAARHFADFLRRAKQSCWQVLPLNPPQPGASHSPYDALSAFAGYELLISPDDLAESGLLSRRELREAAGGPTDRTDYAYAARVKGPLLRKACERFAEAGTMRDFERFCRTHAHWLEDYARFVVLWRHLKKRHWYDWPRPYRDRTGGWAKIFADELARPLRDEKLKQFFFFRQWHALKEYANRRGIQIFGDMPIYVSQESADVWSHPELFQLDARKRPKLVTGVPPDAFSRTGQLWNNPAYDWEAMKNNGFAWWLRRMEHNYELFDLVRVDHFRGFVAYWGVKAGRKTAVKGRWIPAPGEKLFTALLRRRAQPPIIVEDLGTITPDVREFVAERHLPCMKVLLFAFDGEADNPYLPHNHDANAVVYTGTHDNNTVCGWWADEAGRSEKKAVREYLGRRVGRRAVAREFIRLAMQSVCSLAIVPMQDVLELGSSARMNHPARRRGNWRWRMGRQAASTGVARRLAKLTRISGRA